MQAVTSLVTEGGFCIQPEYRIVFRIQNTDYCVFSKELRNYILETKIPFWFFCRYRRCCWESWDTFDGVVDTGADHSLLTGALPAWIKRLWCAQRLGSIALMSISLSDEFNSHKCNVIRKNTGTSQCGCCTVCLLMFLLEVCYYKDFFPPPSLLQTLLSHHWDLHISALSLDSELIKNETGTMIHSERGEFLISKKQKMPQEPTISMLQQCLPFVCHFHIDLLTDHVNWCLFRH